MALTNDQTVSEAENGGYLSLYIFIQKLPSLDFIGGGIDAIMLDDGRHVGKKLFVELPVLPVPHVGRIVSRGATLRQEVHGPVTDTPIVKGEAADKVADAHETRASVLVLDVKLGEVEFM